MTVYGQLTNEEKLLANSEAANNQKSVGVTYLIWFFLSGLGIHRFYLGYKGTALIMLALTGLGALTSFLLIGYLFFFIVGIWALVDLFRIPGMVRRQNEWLREKYAQSILNNRIYS